MPDVETVGGDRNLPLWNIQQGHAPIDAFLDFHEDIDDETVSDHISDKDIWNDDVQQPQGIMHIYLQAILKRLQFETTGKGAKRGCFESKMVVRPSKVM
jgi:hypothetical protein